MKTLIVSLALMASAQSFASITYNCFAAGSKLTLVVQEPVIQEDLVIQETSGVAVDHKTLKSTDLRFVFENGGKAVYFFDDSKAPAPLKYSGSFASESLSFPKGFMGEVYVNYKAGDRPSAIFCSQPK